MPDREQAIKGLKEIAEYMEARADVAGVGKVRELFDSWYRAAADALALLREQEKPDCEHAEHDGVGCLGYAGCTQDDEPIVACKTCRKYTGNRYGEVTMDD